MPSRPAAGRSKRTLESPPPRTRFGSRLMEAQRSGPYGMEPCRAVSGPRPPMPTPGWFLRPGPSAVSRRLTASPSLFDMAVGVPKATARLAPLLSPSNRTSTKGPRSLTRGTDSSVATGQPISVCHRSSSPQRRGRPRAGLMVAADGVGGFAPRLPLCSPFHPACSSRDNPPPIGEPSARAAHAPKRVLRVPSTARPCRHRTRCGGARGCGRRPGPGSRSFSPCGWSVATRRMRRARPQHAPPSRRRLPVGHAIGWGAAGSPAVGHTPPPPSRCGPAAAEPMAVGLWVLSLRPHATPLLSGRH